MVPGMAEFRSRVSVPFPLAEVFAWHQRPGALVRLCPPWNSSVASPPSDGLAVGSTATLRLHVPGTFGKVGVKWVAEHVALEPGRSFTDVMASGPLRSWRHHHAFEATDDGTATAITDTITFRGPIPGADPLLRPLVAKTLDANFAYRGRQLAADLEFHAQHPGPPKVIAIAGASGMIGTQLCALLSTGGHDVRRLVRRPARAADEITWDPSLGTIRVDDLADVDAVIHLGGRTIGGRFNTTNKQEMRSSRLDSTALLASAVADVAQSGHPVTFVCASAIGIYGARHGDEMLGEDATHGNDFLATLCADWERATAPAAEAGARVVNVRTGIVQSPAGGALGQQLPLFRLGLGGPLGNGQQWLSWISLDDIVGVFAHAALTESVNGPINAVAPNPVRGREYAQTLGAVLHRPARIPVPSLGPRLLLGRQGATELALASQRVDASALAASGYRFRHADLRSALAHVLGH